MTDDPIAKFKEAQKQGWAYFAPLEALTTPSAARLVKFAGVRPGQRVLDVACGTGVVAITAARLGAKVDAIDLTPQLLDRAARIRAWLKWRSIGARATRKHCRSQTVSSMLS